MDRQEASQIDCRVPVLLNNIGLSAAGGMPLDDWKFEWPGKGKRWEYALLAREGWRWVDLAWGVICRNWRVLVRVAIGACERAGGRLSCV